MVFLDVAYIVLKVPLNVSEPTCTYSWLRYLLLSFNLRYIVEWVHNIAAGYKYFVFNVVGKQRRNAETSGTSLLTAAPVDSLSDVVLDTALSHFDVDLRSVACHISPTPVIFGDLQGNFSCALQS